MTLAIGIAGEFFELPTPLDYLGLIVTIASLAVLSKVAPGVAAGDP